jgi:hypothetical protein
MEAANNDLVTAFGSMGVAVPTGTDRSLRRAEDAIDVRRWY